MRTGYFVWLILAGILPPLSGWAQPDDALTVAAREVAEKLVLAAEQKQGVVAEMDNATTPVTIYVTLGSKDGVIAGQLLTIFAKGDPIIVDGKAVGNRMKTVGTAEITQVQNENLCMAAMKTTVPGQYPAKGNVASLKGVPHMLAVSTFLRPDNAGSMMGQEFADKLGTALQASGRFGMLERARFDAVLGELKLGLNDLFDPAKVAQLGKQLQAQAVVLGTITQQNDRYAINSRVVEIQSGIQVASATATCGRSDELDRKYDQTTVIGGGGGDIAFPPTGAEGIALTPKNVTVLAGGPMEYGTTPIAVGGRPFDDYCGFPFAVGDSRFYTTFDIRDYSSFSGWVGVDDNRPNETGTLTIKVDGETVATIRKRSGEPAERVQIPLKGRQSMTLQFGEQKWWVLKVGSPRLYK